MSLQEIFSQLSLWMGNFLLQSYTFCLYNNLSQLLPVWIWIHNTVTLCMCRWVDLSHSGRLSELEPHAFPSILRLQSLSLAHTAITSLPPDTVPARRLLLDGVRLACTCQQLAWLATDDVSAADDDVTSGATCLSPGRLHRAGRVPQPPGRGEHRRVFRSEAEERCAGVPFSLVGGFKYQVQR